MKDEIQEIINDLQRVADRKCYPEDILNGSIAQEWVDYLEDYITNLQEKYDIAQKDIETLINNYNDLVKMSGNKITNLQKQLHQASLDIQELTEKDIDCPSWCDKLTNLQEENKKLNDELKRLHNLLNSQAYQDLDNYKSRNEKAIERLNNIINEANLCILDFLMTEEYIKVDGIAIADNYNKLMNILGTPNNYDELKEGK